MFLHTFLSINLVHLSRALDLQFVFLYICLFDVLMRDSLWFAFLLLIAPRVRSLFGRLQILVHRLSNLVNLQIVESWNRFLGGVFWRTFGVAGLTGFHFSGCVDGFIVKHFRVEIKVFLAWVSSKHGWFLGCLEPKRCVGTWLLNFLLWLFAIFLFRDSRFTGHWAFSVEEPVEVSFVWWRGVSKGLRKIFLLQI